MMTTFNIVANNQSAVIERLLRVVRHRGFIIKSLDVQTSDDELNIVLAVDSDRAVSLLVNQLKKLYDVNSIEQK